LAAEPPAGIVMTVSGVTDPPLAAMTEIAPGAAIKLGANGRLTFLDYARCKLVTVSGGTLVLGRSDYTTDGRVENETDGPCPIAYSIAKDGGARTTAGMVMRGKPEPTQWPVNAQLLLTGSRARGFSTAAIYAEHKPETPAATLLISDGKAVVSPGLPLLPNRRYVLRLVSSDQSKTTEIVFMGIAPLQPQPILILRLD
jgi:hypothetical protein